MDEQLLIKYLQGKPDNDSAGDVEKWIQLSDENRKKAEDTYFLLFLNDRIEAEKSIDVNDAFDEFKATKMLSRSKNRARIIPLWLRMLQHTAAAVVLLLAGLFITLTYVDNHTLPTLVSTKLGERAEVTLPDGSKVWLNACSRLEYKKSLIARTRKVVLAGEAYFEVAHSAHLPFVVRNEKTEIKVLGTKFNVRSNDDENYTTATLFDGSVLFSDNKDVNITLKPGEELVFDKTTHTAKVHQLDFPQNVLNWINGKLVFENSTLEYIAKNLERYYNVNILFKDEKVKQKRFTAEFETADNIYQILSVLELTKKFKYKIDKRDVYISTK